MAQEIVLDDALVDVLHHSDAGQGKELDEKLRSVEVRELLTLLQSEHREVLYLYYYEQKTYDEIADIIRRPAGTVAALMHRAKKEFGKLALRTGLAAHFTFSV